MNKANTSAPVRKLPAMRDDLMSALETVKWAVSQFHPFQERLIAWTEKHMEIVIKDTDPPTDHKIAVAQETEPLPFAFNVEAGAYINVIRSSFDILASALSTRNGKTGNVEAYFPIYRSDLHMLDPLRGLESVKWLTKDQRAVIKSLEPYPGGSNALYPLHQLDIMRKHRRLLAVRVMPSSVRITGIRRAHVEFPGKMGIGANGETLLAFISREAPADGKVDATFVISLDEAGHLGDTWVVLALMKFADAAETAIRRFDR
jgi:hypothetical protein